MIQKMTVIAIVSVLFVSCLVVGTLPLFAEEKPSTVKPAQKMLLKENVITEHALQPAAQVFKIENLTIEKFEALPGNALIEVNGKQMTKEQALALPKTPTNQVRNDAAAKAARARFEAYRAKFLQDQKSRIEANNAIMRAKFASLTQKGAMGNASKRDAIKNETADLQRKYQAASPDEKAKIDARAGELMQQMKQMQSHGPGGPSVR